MLSMPNPLSLIVYASTIVFILVNIYRSYTFLGVTGKCLNSCVLINRILLTKEILEKIEAILKD